MALSRSRYSSPHLTERINASMQRILVTSRHIVTQKYRRQLDATVGPNLEKGVNPADCVLAQFHWTAIKFVQEEQVNNALDLPRPKHSLLGMMAIAFDLADDEFEEICGLLHPVHVKNARKFRQHWKEAHERQSQLQDATKETYRQKTEARRAIKKMVAEQYSETNPAIAYDTGCSQLAAETGLMLYALLPYGVERARAVELGRTPDWANAPSFETLSAKEAQIVTLIVGLLANLDDDGFELEMMSRYPQMAEQITMFMELAARFATQGHWPSKLPDGPLPDNVRPQWLDDIFENIMSFFLFWDTTVQDDDVPH